MWTSIHVWASDQVNHCPTAALITSLKTQSVPIPSRNSRCITVTALHDQDNTIKMKTWPDYGEEQDSFQMPCVFRDSTAGAEVEDSQ